MCFSVLAPFLGQIKVRHSVLCAATTLVVPRAILDHVNRCNFTYPIWGLIQLNENGDNAIDSLEVAVSMVCTNCRSAVPSHKESAVCVGK